MKKYLKTSLLAMVIMSPIFAETMHSDGTNTGDWSVYSGEGEIQSIDGAIHFDGSGLSSAYRLDIYNSDDVISWKMNRSDNPYVVYLRIKTQDGIRHLRYRDREKNLGLNKNGTYIHYELGEFNAWQEFSRDINADLKKYQPDNEFIEIERMYVRGDIAVDDVKTDIKAEENLFQVLMEEEFKKYQEQEINMGQYRLQFLNNNQFACVLEEDFENIEVGTVAWYTLYENRLVKIDLPRLSSDYGHSSSLFAKFSEDSQKLSLLKVWENYADTKYTYDISDPKNVQLIEEKLSESYSTNHIEQSEPSDWKISGEGTVTEDHYGFLLQGSGRATAYRLNISDQEKKADSIDIRLEHPINNKEDYTFTAYVIINTKKGVRYMTYTGDSDNLGLADDGFSIRIAQKDMRPNYWDYWNVREDLEKYEPDNEFVSLEKFIIRGDIKLNRLITLTDAYGFESETVSYEKIQ